MDITILEAVVSVVSMVCTIIGTIYTVRSFYK